LLYGILTTFSDTLREFFSLAQKSSSSMLILTFCLFLAKENCRRTSRLGDRCTINLYTKNFSSRTYYPHGPQSI